MLPLLLPRTRLFTVVDVRGLRARCDIETAEVASIVLSLLWIYLLMVLYCAWSINCNSTNLKAPSKKRTCVGRWSSATAKWVDVFMIKLNISKFDRLALGLESSCFSRVSQSSLLQGNGVFYAAQGN